MFCKTCKQFWPYKASASCIVCGKPLSLTADDLLGDTPARIVSEVRPAQVEYTKAVTAALLTGRHATIEAGTGTGKSYGVVLPPLLEGKRIVISTATTLLQAQYIDEDLPFLRSHLLNHGRDFSFAIAKGRSHYLCPKIYNAQKEWRLAQGDFGMDFCKWAAVSVFQDKQELEPRKIPFPECWPEIDAEDCQGAKLCAQSYNCGRIRAKRAQLTASVIVANHSIVGFDIRFGGLLLPPYDVMILDEAHNAEMYIRKAFSRDFGERRIDHLLANVVRDGILAAGILRTVDLNAGSQSVVDIHEAMRCLPRLNKALFADFSGTGRDRKFDPSSIVKTADEILAQIDVVLRFLAPLSHSTDEKDIDQDVDFVQKKFGTAPNKVGLPAAPLLLNRFRRAACDLHFITHPDPNGDGYVRYLEYPTTRNRSRSLKAIPLNIAPRLQAHIFPAHQVIATSATLAVDGKFDYLHRDLGFDSDQTDTLVVPSPFDFGNRARLYLTSTVPEPPSRPSQDTPTYRADMLTYNANMCDYYDAMAEEVMELCDYTKGNAFVLFTSREDMREVTRRCVRHLKSRHYAVRMQSTKTSANAMVAWYRSKNSPILFGLKTFWEGVSIKGDKLILVIIAKVPFPSPDDIISKTLKDARTEELGGKREHSIQAFNELIVPNMILGVKQAAGRLLRSMTDFGVVAILDRRITLGCVKPGKYAYTLLRSLPFPQNSVIKSRTVLVKFLRNFIKV